MIPSAEINKRVSLRGLAFTSMMSKGSEDRSTAGEPLAMMFRDAGSHRMTAFCLIHISVAAITI